MAEQGDTHATAAVGGLPLRDCDLIMKGGISSGVIYPRAATKLSETYRLRRVGGASAGAIAAALTAAAEYGRGQGGFAALQDIPTELGANLSGLFQPSPGTKPAFSILSAWLEPAWSTSRKVWASLLQVVRRTSIVLASVTLLLLVPGFAVTVTSRGAPHGLRDWLGVAAGTVVWLPGALAVGFVVAAVVFCRRTLRKIVANGYGLCDGHSTDPSVGQAPLTDWLSAQIDSLAGLAPGTGPLTIGHLWGPQAVAMQQVIAAKDKTKRRVLPEERILAAKERAIDLEVMTTNLTHRRPYKFPFSDRTFFFCCECLRTYFPDSIVNHMVQCSAAAADKIDSTGQVKVNISMKCPHHGGSAVYAVPNAWDLPVVVAARISLSFPGLISAVPLYCVDWTRQSGKRKLIEVWFSDGGISSNFPMHFFDTHWPTRPTFGINLSQAHPDFDAPVWRPSAGASGMLPPSYPITSVPSFLAAVVRTMQNWVDNTQITMPGFRDRIAVVRQRHGEGGINLKMPSTVIEDLANRGAEAAKLFDDFDFDQHRWIRYRVAMSEIDDALTRMYSDYCPPDGYHDFVAQHGPRTKRYPISGPMMTTRERDLTDKLMQHARNSAQQKHPPSAGSVPRPKPLLRLLPRQ